ncbi:HK97 gp10 family phage protein [Amycolatopsis sp. NPDC051373]|uniref:HK97 gp10 family phage protein n=1 Tax=Amycolatopsis sp. NPDC051373 TaxID=3155801 RepID=UPI00344B2441
MVHVVYADEPNWRDKLNGDIQKMFSKVVDDIRDDAIQACPVDTGRLKESIDSTITDDTGRVAANVYYAVFVERGHRIAYRGSDDEVHYTGGVVPPQPFLGPALFRKRDLSI